jgi:hypothetical protein
MNSTTSKFNDNYRELIKRMEQRSHERMQVPLECRVSAIDKRRPDSMRVVENISRSGILIRWTSKAHGNELPALGDMLGVEMVLPVNHTFDPRTWYCSGEVVRITNPEPGAEPTVAVKISTTKIRKVTASGNRLVN